jgi:hypothetical protein
VGVVTPIFIKKGDQSHQISMILQPTLQCESIFLSQTPSPPFRAQPSASAAVRHRREDRGAVIVFFLLEADERSRQRHGFGTLTKGPGAGWRVSKVGQVRLVVLVVLWKVQVTFKPFSSTSSLLNSLSQEHQTYLVGLTHHFLSFLVGLQYSSTSATNIKR